MGAKQTRLRQIYNNMKYRCYAPNLDERTAKAYRNKGIRVCEEWLGYYGNFESWALSHGYKDGLSIDRIDPNGNYCPENCRWVTVEDNRAKRGTLCGYSLKEMTEQEIVERVKSAEPIADALAKVPEASRDIARIAMQSFGAGFIAGNAAPRPTA